MTGRGCSSISGNHPLRPASHTGQIFTGILTFPSRASAPLPPPPRLSSLRLVNGPKTTNDLKSARWLVLPYVLWLAMACGGGAGNPSGAAAPSHGNPNSEETATSAAAADGSVDVAAADDEAGVQHDGGPPQATHNDMDDASGSTTPKSDAAAKPVLAASSFPPGVRALSEAEEAELKERCGGLLKHLRKVSANDSGSRARLERIHNILEHPPALTGVDVPHCAKLLQRSVVAYRAQTIESEGMNGIKRIIVGLSMAMSAAKPKLCPSAPKTPADLKAFQAGPVRTNVQQWQHPGWRCVRFDRSQPSAFQYQLHTSSADQSFEIIARGYPVDGHPPVELFLAGKVKDKTIALSSEIYRRNVSR